MCIVERYYLNSSITNEQEPPGSLYFCHKEANHPVDRVVDRTQKARKTQRT